MTDQPTKISLSSASADDLKVDALVIGVAPRKGRRKGVGVVLGDLTVRAAGLRKLDEALSAVGATGRRGEITKLPGAGIAAAPLIVALGLGSPDDNADDADAALEMLREAAGAATRALAGTKRVGIAIAKADAHSVEAVALGSLLGAYAFRKFRSANDLESMPDPIAAISVVVADGRDQSVRKAVARAETLASAVRLTRDLINTPPGHLPPAKLAAAAVDAAKGLPIEVTVLDEKALAKGHYGGILGVGQGSANPPRLARMAYRHPKAKAHLALVGKGVTFDTGGISIKPAANMHEMKSDMSGAAAVIAAVHAIAALKLPINVTGWIPTAENMPGGKAQRPGDVITIYGGRTVEVLNTDAEGRLILADALVRAAEEKPDVLIDVATLTGAAVIAMGQRTSAIMSNDADLRTRIFDASAIAGEAMWPMPLPGHLRKAFDSSTADIANIGGRYGGMQAAGLFLKEFVDDEQKWAHIDIAGPAYNDGEAWGYTPKGGTGTAVRTFVQLAQEMAGR